MKFLSTSLSLVLLFSAIVAITATATATIASIPAHAPVPPPHALGAYHPIHNVNDPHILDVGKYAVEEYKKQHNITTIFEFREVVSGESAVVAGIKYRLIIRVRSGGLILKYQVIVWEKPWLNFKELEYFKLISPLASTPAPPPPAFGGYKMCPNKTDPHVQDVGKYAVEEYKRLHNIKNIFEFLEIVSCESAVVAGIKYRLIILVRSDGLVHKYEVIVLEKLWLHLRKLLSFKFIPPLAFAPTPAPAPGAYRPIHNVSDPHVQDIGKYAVEEYKKQHNITTIFEFQEVLSGESAVVAGTKYRLIIRVRSGGLLLKYQVIVWEKRWEKYRKLESFKLIRQPSTGNNPTSP